MNINFEQMFNDVSEDMGNWKTQELRAGIKELFRQQTELQAKLNHATDQMLILALEHTTKVTTVVCKLKGVPTK